MTRGRWIAIGSLTLLLGAGQLGLAVESATYTVTKRDGAFEFRDYPASIVAVVTTDGTRSHAVNAGFRLLADYIFGNNQQKSKIAMTAPVTQSRESTAPVALPPAGKVDSWAVRFMMPAGYTLQSLPAPNNERVRFERVAPRPVAAIRFSGFWSDSNLRSHESELRSWMTKQHVTPASAATYAYYDPPWTPWFLRRIEVLIEIATIGQP